MKYLKVFPLQILKNITNKTQRKLLKYTYKYLNGRKKRNESVFLLNVDKSALGCIDFPTGQWHRVLQGVQDQLPLSITIKLVKYTMSDNLFVIQNVTIRGCF